ncbi:Alpha/Beta hydrolase fold [Arabidopsis thaliana x Arabidopsis arenosa]|uniref:Alpha/Beta hydrolase fold n=1 Tax=Arabidopsis thaliana x Arabidopsis arenosa TaxID=1240361 RepID=A0A8T1YYE4_9BRAS|nr:Alpha/Beta hydrolase fold [Arabidopsis thaliana x Arabidopsis arenosa]
MPLPSIILLLLVIFSTISCTHSKEARLSVFPKKLRYTFDGEKLHDNFADLGIKIFFFEQTLDHFTYTPGSYKKFRQRYAVNSKYWEGGKSNAPILAYLGAESSMDSELSVLGFLKDNAPHFKALMVYIEHRFYGETMPFGSADEALKNAKTLGYLNAAQALADYAAILLHIKEAYSAKHSPVIVIGGSYGGMLAAWFKLKYPHIALGALASSAPLLYFEDTLPKHGYFYIVTKVFKETSQKCHNKIRKSWDEIDRIAAKPNGLSILSKKFKLCNPLNDTIELKNYLSNIYAVTAQYNNNNPNSVATLCDAINTSPPNSTKSDILDQIFAGVVASSGNISCYGMSSDQITNDVRAWTWQSCSEMVMPIGYEKEDTMFQPKPFNMSSFTKNCESYYGVSPRPHWVTAYFGSQDVKLIFRRFGNNIIFSNGLLDPYSVGGVLEDISDTVVAITTRDGSHCRDIVLKSKEDPEWLVEQREKEVKIIDSWISTYQKDLNISS